MVALQLQVHRIGAQPPARFGGETVDGGGQRRHRPVLALLDFEGLAQPDLGIDGRKTQQLSAAENPAQYGRVVGHGILAGHQRFGAGRRQQVGNEQGQVHGLLC